MRILVSNDDGILAPGIQALARTLATRHEVHVVAPDRERSATGHALTLHKPLRVEKVHIDDRIASAHAVNGTPSDCIKIAVGALLPDMPDLVLSGINRGPNLGTDVIYSGTVSAALEATILGIPAAALSLATFSDIGYEVAAEFALELATMLADHRLPPKVLLNVNVPRRDEGPVPDVRITRLGDRRYHDSFEPRIDPRGRTYYWLAGEVVENEESPDTDVVAIREGLISITPIHHDMTHRDSIELVRSWRSRPGIAGELHPTERG